MLANCANQRSRNRTLILIDDRKDDAFAAVARLSGSGYNDDHDDRHDQESREPKVVAADEPEIL
jgi:hypothetical protein